MRNHTKSVTFTVWEPLDKIYPGKDCDPPGPEHTDQFENKFATPRLMNRILSICPGSVTEAHSIGVFMVIRTFHCLRLPVRLRASA